MATSNSRSGRQTFSTDRQARALPLLDKPTDYPHATQPGLICRVLTDGRRVFWHRWKLKVPDPLGGGSIEDAGREELGDLGTMTVEEAVLRVGEARRAKREASSEGLTNRLTVKAAWALYPAEKRLHADATREKDTYVYRTYYAWFETKFLDELSYAFWNDMLHKLEKGTLVPSLTGDTSVGTLGPLKSATLRGVINVGVNLYEIAHRHKGLRGMVRTQNPAREAKQNLAPPNVRKGRIPLAKLPAAWRAADQLVSPWWRDMLYVYVLTGLRRNLMHEMRFAELDFRAGVYTIPPFRAGTKRRKAKLGLDAEPIRLPLSKRVLAVLAARRRFAPDPDGPVWFSPRPTRGRAVKQQADEGRTAVLTDARAAWSLISDTIDVRFTPQDLRRTYANLGASSKAEVLAVSLLMLHSGQTLAQATGIAGITVQYFGTPEAQERMRVGAEAVAARMDQLLAMSEAELSRLEDPKLDPMLEAALRDEEAGEAGDEDSSDYE